MKRKFLARLKIVTLGILLCLCLSGCAKTPEFPIAPFEYRLGWSFGGTDLCATVVAIDEGVELSFNSPSCLSGLRLSTVGGEVVYRYGDMTFDGIPEAYLSVLQIFATSGEFDYLCRTDIEGREALCYSRGDARWYFDADTLSPVLVEWSDLSIKILKVK